MFKKYKINEIKEIIKRINKKELLKNSLNFTFYGNDNGFYELNIYFLKGANTYRAELINKINLLKIPTEAKTKDKFISRVKNLIKDKTKGVKDIRKNQLQLKIL